MSNCKTAQQTHMQQEIRQYGTKRSRHVGENGLNDRQMERLAWAQSLWEIRNCDLPIPTDLITSQTISRFGVILGYFFIWFTKANATSHISRTVLLSWRHESRNQGEFMLSYKCNSEYETAQILIRMICNRCHEDMKRRVAIMFAFVFASYLHLDVVRGLQFRLFLRILLHSKTDAEFRFRPPSRLGAGLDESCDLNGLHNLSSGPPRPKLPRNVWAPGIIKKIEAEESLNWLRMGWTYWCLLRSIKVY